MNAVLSTDPSTLPENAIHPRTGVAVSRAEHADLHRAINRASGIAFKAEAPTCSICANLEAESAPLPIDARTPTLEERITAATELAEENFWAIIAQAFPEAEHGDMDPLEVMRLEEHLTRAVREWVEENVPGARKDGE